MNSLIYQPRISESELDNEEKVLAWTKTLVEDLIAKDEDAAIFSAHTQFDEERKLYYPLINIRQHGVDKVYVLNHDFLTSKDYQRISVTGEKITDLMQEGAYVQRGEKTQPVSSFVEALEWLIADSKAYTPSATKDWVR